MFDVEKKIKLISELNDNIKFCINLHDQLYTNNNFIIV